MEVICNFFLEVKSVRLLVSAVLCCECFLFVLIWFIFYVISFKVKREGGGGWWVVFILFIEVSVNEKEFIMYNSNKFLKI